MSLRFFGLEGLFQIQGIRSPSSFIEQLQAVWFMLCHLLYMGRHVREQNAGRSVLHYSRAEEEGRGRPLKRAEKHSYMSFLFAKSLDLLSDATMPALTFAAWEDG